LKKIKVIAIFGPTATGKSALAINLAKILKSEIISADSIQIYKEFNICTAKPTNQELSQVKHHLINCLPVTEDYSVMHFCQKAKLIIENLNLQKKIPIIVGGTGFYIDALIRNYQFVTAPAQRSNCSSDVLFDNLQKIDPSSAASICKNDIKRLQRALDFYESFGISITSQAAKTLSSESIYDAIRIGVNYIDRKKLYKKIDERVEKMLESGLINEIKFVKDNFNVSKTARMAIGYKELIPFLEGKISLSQAVAELKMKTRRYAKRQITWFKREPNTKWFYQDRNFTFEDFLKHEVLLESIVP
jgi:tRNA dimethylallyltransferase